MRLFGRQRNDPMLVERCPHCHEPIPDGAAECKMCGVDLRPLREEPSSEELDAVDPRQGTTSPRRIA